MKPRIGITLGDPAGIGPEVIRAALASDSLPGGFDYLVLGDERGFTPGHPTPESARHAFEALETAVSMALRGELSAIVTGPISKKCMHGIGFDFPGHTEYFAHRTHTADFAMCLTGGSLTVALVTVHVPYSQVISLLNPAEIARVGLLLGRFLRRRGISAPRIAVAGLNPHAGEGGDIGREEIDIIAPAIDQLRRSDPSCQWSGPHAPDTVFFHAARGAYDGVLCMYHDQGLIPLKLHAFDQGVNVTLGLPFPRTSPDHGTAFDIAGKHLARPESALAAIRLASELCSDTVESTDF